MRKYFKRVILLFVFVATGFSLKAQSVPFLNFTENPAAFAKGGAALASNADAFSAGVNPAAIALFDKKAAAAVSYLMWQPTAAQSHQYALSGFAKLGSKWGIGLSGKYFSHPQIFLDNPSAAVSSAFTPAEITAALAVSYRIVDFLSVGANVRFVNSHLSQDAKASAVAGDIAVMAKFNALNVSLAAAHLGSKLDYGYGSYALPAVAKAGVAYNLSLNPTHRISFNAEGDYLLSASSFMAGAGVEYAFKELLSVRAGYHYGDGIAAVSSYASVGLGLKLNIFTLNGAYLLPVGNAPVLKNTFIVSLGIEL